jgi:hypothetical protein
VEDVAGPDLGGGGVFVEEFGQVLHLFGVEHAVLGDAADQFDGFVLRAGS